MRVPSVKVYTCTEMFCGRCSTNLAANFLEIAYERITYACRRDSVVGLRCHFGLSSRPAVSAGQLGKARSFVAGHAGEFSRSQSCAVRIRLATDGHPQGLALEHLGVNCRRGHCLDPPDGAD